jgi:hypothetical protein
MPDPEWKTVRLRAAKHAVITKRAKADGISVAEWLDRTLAVALGDGNQEASASVVAPPRVGAAPRRAPAVVFPASALVNESEAEREARRRARASAERNLGARQAKLNAAKLKRKES